MSLSFSGNLLSVGAAAAGSDSIQRRTPDHPPYSEMVAMALQVFGEEGGSTEAAISVFIQSSFTDIPWGHDRLLHYYLGRLVTAGELTSPSPDRYQLPIRALPSLSSTRSSFTLPRRRGRPPLPRPNPSSSLVISPQPRGRGRRPIRRHRGRPPLTHCIEAAPRRRGRPPLRRDDAVGGTPARKLGFRFRRTGCTKKGYDDFVVGSEGGWHCLEGDGSRQSEAWSLCGALEDAEEGRPFVASGPSEQGEEQLLPGKVLTLLGLEQSEHRCKQVSPEKKSSFLEPEAPSAVATEQSLFLGEEQAFVAPDYEKGQAYPGQGLLLVAPEESKVSLGISRLGDELEAAMVIPQSPDGERAVSTRKSKRKPPAKKRRLRFEQSEHGCKQLSPEKESSFLEPEDYAEQSKGQLTPGELQPSSLPEVSTERGDGQSSAGEAPSAVATEQSLFLGEEQAFVAPDYEKGQAYPGQGLLLVAPEESKVSRGIACLGDELEAAMVIPQSPDGERAVSTRKTKRKPPAKKRRLRFEQSEHGCKQLSPEKESSFLEPEDYAEHSKGKLPPGKLQASSMLEVSAEHGDVQSFAGEAQSSVATEQSLLLGEEQAFVAPVYEKGHSSPGQGLLLVAPEESEGLLSLGDELEMAMVIHQPPDGEKAVSTRKRKPRAKKRRLWFEG